MLFLYLNNGKPTIVTNVNFRNLINEQFGTYICMK